VAGQLAEDAPEIIASPEAARGLERSLIEAMVACLTNGEGREDRSARRRHAMILRRACGSTRRPAPPDVEVQIRP
jgi:hypothetical protein